VTPGDVAELYITEGAAEGVRGDIAFAQAILETGHFTSAAVERHNLAGIAHYDGSKAGRTFPDLRTGVRAHIQLLKKFAAGNQADLAHPDVAPTAGARATTWAQLAGTWASSTGYWLSISRIYGAMLATAGKAGPPRVPPAGGGDCPPPTSTASPATGGRMPLATVEGITVHARIAPQLGALLAAADRDGLHLAGWGYRSPAQQIALRRAHCGTTQYAIYEMPSSRCSPPTARPGRSNHERGLAIDFTCNGGRLTRDSACFAWLAQNAAGYGLYNLPSESWHWSTNGA
jgi:hypothetical protein